MRRPDLRIRLVTGPLVGEEVAVRHFGGIPVMHRIVPGSMASTGCGRSVQDFAVARAVDAKTSWKAQPCKWCWLPKRRWAR